MASASRWWIALGAAAAFLAGTAVLAISKARANSAASTAPAATSRTCSVPQPSLRAWPDAEDPPVILWAVGKVRLYVDGEPAFSPPDDPRHFKVGEHSLRADAEGFESLSTKFKLEPYVPALFHVEADENTGITLVRLGTTCTSCEYPASTPELGFEKGMVPAETLLEGAAASLRKDNWFHAAELLRQMPPKERTRAPFLRLAAAMFVDSLQPEEARRSLEQISVADAHDLRGLLLDLDRLATEERARKQKIQLARWNKLTERFSGMVARFEKEAPAPVGSAARRFEKLSQHFELAARDQDLFAEQEAISAGEEALKAMAADIRAARPSDCAFQNEVVATLVK